jgi:protein SCO1/2
MRFSFLLAALLLGIASCAAVAVRAETGITAQNPSPDQVREFRYKEALANSQDAIGRQLGDHYLTDHRGHALRMAELRGKPLVLSLIYTSCSQICPMTTRHLAKVVEKARDALGEDSFNVAVLGFDVYHDSPQAMAQFAKKQGVDESGWYLLSAGPDTIQALSEELGFEFFSSPSGFDHITQATVIDAQGIVYRQVYGEVFETPLLVEPLKELVFGRPKPDQGLLAGLLDRVNLFCTSYDPFRDAYFYDYSLFVGMAIGASIIIAGIVMIVRELRRGRGSVRT